MSGINLWQSVTAATGNVTHRADRVPAPGSTGRKWLQPASALLSPQFYPFCLSAFPCSPHRVLPPAVQEGPCRKHSWHSAEHKPSQLQHLGGFRQWQIRTEIATATKTQLKKQLYFTGWTASDRRLRDWWLPVICTSVWKLQGLDQYEIGKETKGNTEAGKKTRTEQASELDSRTRAPCSQLRLLEPGGVLRNWALFNSSTCRLVQAHCSVSWKVHFTAWVQLFPVDLTVYKNLRKRASGRCTDKKGSPGPDICPPLSCPPPRQQPVKISHRNLPCY